MQTKNLILVGSLTALGVVAIIFSTQNNSVLDDQSLISDGTVEGEAQAAEVSALSISQEESDMTSSKEIEWLTDYDQALQQAKTDNKLVVIDFFATWCGPCKVMERTTFANERVRSRMKDFVPLKIDVDKQGKIATRYGIQGMPTTAVVKADGETVTGTVGLLGAEDFLGLLSTAEAKNAQ